MKNLQEKLLEEVFDEIVKKVPFGQPDFFDAAALHMSQDVLSPIIEQIKTKCDKKKFLRHKYLYPSIFNKKDDEFISYKTLHGLYKAKEENTITPISPNNEPTWCILSLYINKFGWKGYREGLSIEDAIIKFRKTQDSKNDDRSEIDEDSEELNKKENCFLKITTEDLEKAKKEADKVFSELDEIKRKDSKEFERLLNKHTNFGKQPEWYQIFLRNYGLIERKKVQTEIYIDIERNLRELKYSESKFVFHLLSGNTGVGKTSLAYLTIYNLINWKRKDEFYEINETIGSFGFYIVTKYKSENQLIRNIEKELRNIQPSNAPIFIFIDDPFLLKEETFSTILEIIGNKSKSSTIYLLLTSPDCLTKKNFIKKSKSIYEFLEGKTKIEEKLNNDESEELIKQYYCLYEEDCKNELIYFLGESEESIILLKLILNHNLDFSFYLDHVFSYLSDTDEEYLAILLLSSIFARSNVYLPIDIIRLLNNKYFSNNTLQLPDELNQFKRIENNGIELFRIRDDYKSEVRKNLIGTVTPFHDSIADLIYETWGESRKVPILELPLKKIEYNVLRIIKDMPEYNFFLAFYFRGKLANAKYQDGYIDELEIYISEFGPIRNNKWNIENIVDAKLWINLIDKHNFDNSYSEQLLKELNLKSKWESQLHKELSSEVCIVKFLCLFLMSPGRVKNLRSFESGVGNVLLEYLKKDDVDFSYKSMSLRTYYEYYKSYYERDNIAQIEEPHLENVLNWHLLSLENEIDDASFLYSFQDILEMLLKINITNFSEQLLTEIFQNKISIYLDKIPSGFLTEMYFEWLFKNQKEIDINLYLNITTKNVDKLQTPFFLKNLILAIVKSKNGMDDSAILNLWDVLQEFISNRLDSAGTTGAVRSFFEFISKNNEVFYIETIEQISNQFIEKYKEVNEKGRSIFLLLNFHIFWDEDFLNMDIEDIIKYWELEIELNKTDTKNINVCGELTQKIYKKLIKTNKETSNFDKKVLSFINDNIKNPISARLHECYLDNSNAIDEIQCKDFFFELLSNQYSYYHLQFVTKKYLYKLHGKEKIEFCIQIMDLLSKNTEKDYWSKVYFNVLSHSKEANLYGLFIDTFIKFIKNYRYTSTDESAERHIYRAIGYFAKGLGVNEEKVKDYNKKIIEEVSENTHERKAIYYIDYMIKTFEDNQLPQVELTKIIPKLILDIEVSRWEKIVELLKSYKRKFPEGKVLNSKIDLDGIIKGIREEKGEFLEKIKNSIEFNIELSPI